MFSMHRSPLLVAVCILGFSKFITASDITCKISQEFTVEISNHERATISGGKLNVNVEDEETKNCLFPISNSLEFQANRAIATFRGYLRNENDNLIMATKPRDIFVQIPGMIFIADDQTLTHSVDSSNGNCHTVFLPLGNIKYASTVDPKLSRAIRLLAESCVEVNRCLVMDLITININNTETKLSSSNKNDVPSILSVNFPIRKIVAKESGLPKSQDINQVVDAGVVEVIDYVKREGQTQIPVPDFDVSYSSGEFHAKYGKFRNLTTLRRKSDIILLQNGNNLSISCAFGPEVAKIVYDYYHMTYGLMSSEGWLAIRATDLAIEIGVSIDYSGVPCVSTLDHVKSLRMGEIEIEITGLGWLNWLLKKIVSQSIKQYSDNIAESIETEIQNYIEARFMYFDCEIFRPFAGNT